MVRNKFTKAVDRLLPSTMPVSFSWMNSIASLMSALYSRLYTWWKAIKSNSMLNKAYPDFPQTDIFPLHITAQS